MTQNGGSTHYSLRLSQSMYNRNTLFRHDANRKPTQPTKGDHRYSLPLKPTTQNTTPAIKRNITRLQNICNRDNARQNSSYYRTSRTRTTPLLRSGQLPMKNSQAPAYRKKASAQFLDTRRICPNALTDHHLSPQPYPPQISKICSLSSSHIINTFITKTSRHSATPLCLPHEPNPASRQEQQHRNPHTYQTPPTSRPNK